MDWKIIHYNVYFQKKVSKKPKSITKTTTGPRKKKAESKAEKWGKYEKIFMKKK